MRYKLFSNRKILTFLLGHLLIFTESFASDDHFQVQTKLSTISHEDESALHDFLFDLISTTECGYVLYGNKPICFLGVIPPGVDCIGTVGHHKSVFITSGMKTWEKLQFPKESDNYILHMYNHAENHDEPTDVILINRSAFFNVVNANLILFQYVLGPDVTAEKLLKDLLDPSKDFISVLKNDDVLIGILLGFGTNNALYVSRSEQISGSIFRREKGIILPSLQIDDIKASEPSFGYHSVEEELEDLYARSVLSSRNLSEQSPILYFGCLPETEESKSLIKHYEDTQLKLIQVLESNNFLSAVLSRFFGQQIDDIIPVANKDHLPFREIFANKILSSYQKPFNSEFYPINWPAFVAYLIRVDFDDTISNDEERAFFDLYIDGMRDADKNDDALFDSTFGAKRFYRDLLPQEYIYLRGFKVWAHYKSGNTLYSLNKVIQLLSCNAEYVKIPFSAKVTLYTALNELHQYIFQEQHQKEIRNAEHFFKEKANSFNPPFQANQKYHYVYYQPIVNGNGAIVHQDDTIILRYSTKTQTGITIYESTEAEELDLRRAVYGLRKGSEGLKVGSRGILYIHPNYGFRDRSWLPFVKPFLVVEIEIIAIK